ncbi:hypothetical protein [Adhaeribacter aquaticus]|uniref:hypothetical protein n=1 Tax=Adhaeribacter aquaticus TaxID=299567 RepID=UPI00047AD443|nr:hypothetical protein [Adhaeribacter aquaticus]
MKRQLFIYRCISLSLLLILLSFHCMAISTKDLVGAWRLGPANQRTVMIATDKIISVATYDIPGKKFISSYGGTWRLDGNKLVIKQEWNSAAPEQVGQETSQEVQVSQNKLHIKGKNQTWTRLDDGKPGALMGAWIITGNYTNDQVSKRPSPFYPRRTMKILSGTHFHWIAYNIETKQFMNSGGGTYTTDNGKYTEEIEFFTKTPESVGKKLTFEYAFVNGDWRHKGEESTGGPMDECWTRRETFEK